MSEGLLKFTLALIKECSLEKEEIIVDSIIEKPLVSKTDALECLGNSIVPKIFSVSCNRILKKDEDTFIFCTEQPNYLSKYIKADSKSIDSFYRSIEAVIHNFLGRNGIKSSVEILREESNIVFKVEFSKVTA